MLLLKTRCCVAKLDHLNICNYHTICQNQHYIKDSFHVSVLSNPKNSPAVKSMWSPRRPLWKKMWNPRWRPRNGYDGTEFAWNLGILWTSKDTKYKYTELRGRAGGLPSVKVSVESVELLVWCVKLHSISFTSSIISALYTSVTCRDLQQSIG